ncbi:MAG TPA: aminotransferase class V-fold PLP-dependent enzyme [Prolixibacteraceae bacterium]|nr:aminotransferase class V-fold PLP-dependent enzyme [Prolixibacteraceae bacterium]
MENEQFTTDILTQKKVVKVPSHNKETDEKYDELEKGVYAALETYSNVHRGSGHYSMATTHLYEEARSVVLEYLHLDASQYAVLFFTPRRVAVFTNRLEPGSYELISSLDVGLSLGVRALAVRKDAMPKGVFMDAGGGSARLIARDWVVWAAVPDRFEAGTPAIINIIAFARALKMVSRYGKDIFREPSPGKKSVEALLYKDELEGYSGFELLNRLKQTLIGKTVKVPTLRGDRPFINLDNSASTPTFTPVWDAFRRALRLPPSSWKELTQEVRMICADVLDAPLDDYDMIFTSNTTEAINLAAQSTGNEDEQGFIPVVLSTLFEHSSNDLPWRMLPHCLMIRLEADADGFLDLKELERQLWSHNEKCQHGNRHIRLVAISGASNVLGTCNHLASISTIAHRYGAGLLVDAAQLVAHRKIDMEGSGIDYLAFSAHKVYAPFGCGMLIARKGMLSFNASEREKLHSWGEENVGGIAALGKSLVLLKRIGMEVIQQEEQALTSHALKGMATIPGLRVYGIKDSESPAFAQKIGVIVFSMKSLLSSRVGSELATGGGIGVRTGCHCAHMIIKHLLHISSPIEQFQRIMVNLFPKLSLPGLVRVSFGIENSIEEIDLLIHMLRKIARQSSGQKEMAEASWAWGRPIYSKEEIQMQLDDFLLEVSWKVYSLP